MVQVKIRAAGKNAVKNVGLDQTIKQVLEDSGIDYANPAVIINLDGRVLGAGEINKTFADFAFKSGDSAFLGAVVKMEGARA